MVKINFEFNKKVLISIKAMEKIYSYTNAVDTEVGGILLIDTKGKNPLIKDALIFNQKAGRGDVELDMGSLTTELTKMKKEDVEMLKGWWHSHNDMDTFWSGTDDAQFENMINLSPVVYGVVVNKAGKLRLRIDVKTEVGIVSIDKIKLHPLVSINKKYIEEARAKVNFKKKNKRNLIIKTIIFTKDLLLGGSDSRGLQTTNRYIRSEEHE